MDYLEIVLRGYFNENNREHLEKYFFREFKKAEKEHYEAKEFFNGCLKVIEDFEMDINKRLNERKGMLSLELNEAKKGTLKYAENDNSKPIEQMHKETIKHCQQELAAISKDNFTVHLHSITSGRITHDLKYNEVVQIRDAILWASLKVTNYEAKKALQALQASQLQQTETKVKNKIPAKYYALYHLILIEMGIENDFERNENDQYKKSKIEAFARERHPKTSSQGFYRHFTGIDITNRLAIANSYGAGYKEKIIEISKNNSKVIIHLKDYPK
ncbi:hypothetical protein ES705_38019 [subsurface metagenome]